MRVLKKLAVPLAVFLALGFFATVFTGCDNPANGYRGESGGSDGSGDPPPPFRPVHPDQPRVPGNVTVDIFNFNDFHGALDNSVSESDPGAARFAAVTRHLMSGSEHSMLLAGGDNYIGQPTSDIFYGRPTSRIFRELGVSYSVVGNHEWDWGFDKFEEFVYYGHLHFLAANIFYENTNTRPDIFHPYVVINRAGRRIAIVGFTLVSTPRVVVASAIEGFEFRNSGPWIGEMVTRLREYYGAEAVLALTHENNMGILGNLANQGFDAIFSAHSHTIMNELVNGVPVVRTSHNGRSLARVSLDFDDAGLVGVRTNVYQNFVDGTHLPVGTVDPAVDAIVRQYDALTAPHLSRILGIFGSGISAGRHAWANQLVFDYVTRNRPDWSDVVLIQNNGGWRDIGHQDPTSLLTVRHVWTLMPFINEIYLFRLRGENLIHLLNGRNAINTQNAAGSGTVNVRNVDGEWTIVSTGQTITANGLYQVSMNDFMFTGGDNFGVEDLVSYPYPIVLGTTLRDAIIRQVEYSPPEIVPVTGVLAAWDFSGNSAVNNALVQPERTAVRSSGGYQLGYTYLQFLTQSGGTTTPRVLVGMSMAVNVRDATDEGSSGLDGLANNAWWQTVISTVGYEDIEVTWRMRSTTTGPRDWRLQYRAGSVGDWNNVGGVIAVPLNPGGGNPAIADQPLKMRFLPPSAEGQERLYLRWLMTSNVSAAGGMIAATGTHQINNIVIRADADPFDNEYNCDHCNDAGCEICDPEPDPPPAPISIAAANEIPSAPMASAEVVTVEGFVGGQGMNLAGTALDNANIFVQDGTGPRDGILVWGANLGGYVGQWVRVTGSVTPAGGAGSPRNQIQLGTAGTITVIDPGTRPTFGPRTAQLADMVTPYYNYWYMSVSLGPVQFGHTSDLGTFLTAPGVNTALPPARSHFVIVDGGHRIELRPPVGAGPSPWDDFETGEYIMIEHAYVSWQNGRRTVQLLHAQVERANGP